jgi:uncharacterized glyoxalase superfamily protein PhnB
MLGECRDEMAAEQTGNHSWFIHLLVEHVDDDFTEISARSAEIVTTPTDRECGLRELTVRTPDGHRLMIGEESHSDQR